MHPALSAFQAEHGALDGLHRAHLAAVIALDRERAATSLDELASALEEHMTIEETLLLPTYEAHVDAPRHHGADLYRRDHEKLREQLARLRTGLHALDERGGWTHDGVIEHLDRELGFRHLLHHHDDRECVGLFRLLDEALAPEVHDELWQKVARARSAPSGGAGTL